MGRLRVVIADDRQQVRQELRAILPLAGEIEVVAEAANGLEAARLAESLRPDVVLLDLQMPVMDGYAAARRIKAVCPGCRVIALTIHGDEGSRRRAAEAGFDGFIVKGAAIAEIVAAFCDGVEDSNGRHN